MQKFVPEESKEIFYSNPEEEKIPETRLKNILVLLDLSDTLFFRDYPPKDERREVYGVRGELHWKGRFHYFRPGYIDLIERIQHHPRSVLAFYSSIAGSNLHAILEALLKPVKFDREKPAIQALD